MILPTNHFRRFLDILYATVLYSLNEEGFSALATFLLASPRSTSKLDLYQALKKELDRHWALPEQQQAGPGMVAEGPELSLRRLCDQYPEAGKVVLALLRRPVGIFEEADHASEDILLQALSNKANNSPQSMLAVEWALMAELARRRESRKNLPPPNDPVAEEAADLLFKPFVAPNPCGPSVAESLDCAMEVAEKRCPNPAALVAVHCCRALCWAIAKGASHIAYTIRCSV